MLPLAWRLNRPEWTRGTSPTMLRLALLPADRWEVSWAEVPANWADAVSLAGGRARPVPVFTCSSVASTLTVPVGRVGVPVSLASARNVPAAFRSGTKSLAMSAVTSRKSAVRLSVGLTRPATSSSACRRPSRNRSTASPSPKAMRTGVSKRRVSLFQAASSSNRVACLALVSSLAVLRKWTSDPAIGWMAADSCNCNPSRGPVSPMFAEPDTLPEDIPSSLISPSKTGCRTGSVTVSARMERSAVAVPVKPARCASSCSLAQGRLPCMDVSSVALTLPVSGWSRKGRNSSKCAMASSSLPSGKSAPFGSVRFPLACALFQMALSITTCKLPSGGALALRARSIGAPPKAPRTVNWPEGAPGKPSKFSLTAIGPRGSDWVARSPFKSAVTANLSRGPTSWPCATSWPDPPGRTAARSLSENFQLKFAVCPASLPSAETASALPSSESRERMMSLPRRVADMSIFAALPTRLGSGGSPPVTPNVPSVSSLMASPWLATCRVKLVLPCRSKPPKAANGFRSGRSKAMSARKSSPSVRALPSAAIRGCFSVNRTGLCGASRRMLACNASGADSSKPGCGPGSLNPLSSPRTCTSPALPCTFILMARTLAPAAFKLSMSNLPSALGLLKVPRTFVSSAIACQDKSGRSCMAGALALTVMSAASCSQSTTPLSVACNGPSARLSRVCSADNGPSTSASAESASMPWKLA